MKILKSKIKNSIRGSSILELLFYIALFTALSLVVINAMISMTKSFKETSLQGEFAQSGSIMERMVREMRQAYAIGSITSNTLLLNSTEEDGDNKTIEFRQNGDNIELWENSALTGNLNASSISITGLTFTSINTAEGKAVKVYITLTSDRDASGRAVEFYDTVVLRGEYE